MRSVLAACPAACAGRLAARALPALFLAALLAACGSAPRAPAAAPGVAAPLDPARDGPPADPPADLTSRPDPEPRVEPLRSGGPNKPYEVLGRQYTPLAADVPVVETGLASWYGRRFHGRRTASGEVYDMYASSAAHRTMPIPSYALVRNPANGREVVVRVNDRGPFHADRVIDLSYAAAAKLGVLRGVAPVEVRRLTHDDIRSGRWRDAAYAATVPGSEDVAGANPSAMASPAPAAAPAAVPAAAPSAPAAALATAPAAVVPSTVVAPVALVAPVPRSKAATPAAAGFWVQLGAFRQREGAHDQRQRLVQELAWLEPWLAIFDEDALHRLQAGPFATRTEAQAVAERVGRAAALQPMVLQRR
jgi:rare lipoprotein A